MNKNTQAKKPRDAYLYEALFSFLALVVVMSVGIVKYEASPHIPMLIGAAFASLVALRIGYKWAEIRSAMYHGIGHALQAIIILMLIGVLVGVWILAGVVPSMIYYGLNILSPSFFLVATLLICSVTSLATGTSWGTMGTMGIALIGISHGLGIPLHITAGAIISGAYFGDKMSPLSDTTNLAPVISGTDLFTHIKFMILPTAIAYGLTLIFFGYISSSYSASNLDINNILILQETLKANFTIHPILMLPPIIVIAVIAFKMPPIPGITIGIISGAVMAPIFQVANFGDILAVGYDGFKIQTGQEAIDQLLNTGGLMNMMGSVSLTIIAMMFGGILEKTGQLEVMIQFLLRFLKSAQSLVAGTMGTCILSNATMPEQYISIVVPGRMFLPAYEKKGLHGKTLSNALESGGTVTSPLIPWNTCGIFITATLGVSTISYLPWAFFNYVTPLVVMILAFLGPTIAYKVQAKTKIKAKAKTK